jgi:hypothetical protein
MDRDQERVQPPVEAHDAGVVARTRPIKTAPDSPKDPSELELK